MKTKSPYLRLFYVLITLTVMIMNTTYAQESVDIHRNKSLFIEAGGSGVAMLTANFDFRFNKGRNDGLGMRVGIGGESSKTEPLLGEGETSTKLFTIPLEVNYILGEKRFSFEIGYSLTYVSESKNSRFRLFNPGYTSENESGNFIVSYIPVGCRLKPKKDGFMLKFNVGPLWNYSAANIFSDDKIQFWAGFALGYSFY
jgi:hypothetical protein